MSILIKGMKMPKNGHTVTITVTGHGEVYVEYYDCRPHLVETIAYTAIPVHPHGKLIDILDVPNALRNYFDIGDSYVYNLTRVKEAFAVGTVHLDDFVEWDENDIDELTAYISANTPTILEAEGETE